jgi:multiple sugar transport system ATP-binding protein
VIMDLPEAMQRALKDAGIDPAEITVGVRPEHIVICSDQTPNRIKATVDVSEMMGSSIHLHVSVADKSAIIVQPVTEISETSLLGFRFGSEVNFTFDGSVAHLFCKETGINILG